MALSRISKANGTLSQLSFQTLTLSSLFSTKSFAPSPNPCHSCHLMFHLSKPTPTLAVSTCAEHTRALCPSMSHPSILKRYLCSCVHHGHEPLSTEAPFLVAVNGDNANVHKHQMRKNKGAQFIQRNAGLSER